MDITTENKAPARRSLPGWAWALLLALLTFAAYLPALRGAFVWDDELYAANPLLASPGGLAKIWALGKDGQFHYPEYYPEFPVVYTSFWLERRLWGLNTTGFHAVNIILHILNALLAWFILKKLGLRHAWLAAAVFALHPVQAESVAWITERKNLLSALFYLLALAAWLRHTESGKNRWYFAALAVFPAALLSKPVACTLPVIILLLEHLRGKATLKTAAKLVPFFLMSAAAGLFTLSVENPAQYLGFTLHPADRLLLAGRALWFYPAKLLWPIQLSFSYTRWDLEAARLAQWLWPALALAALGTLLKFRGRINKQASLALWFYIITIAPLLGFADVYTFRYSYVADHYQYLACLGLIALATGLVSTLVPEQGRGRYYGMLAAAILLCTLAGLTWRQSGIYRDPETLWTDTLIKNPSSWMARNNLGIYLDGQGRTSEALAQYRETVRLKPDYAEAQYNCALALDALGRNAEAAGYYRTALKLRPAHAPTHLNYGFDLALTGRAAEAEVQYKEALRLDPGCAEAYLNLGLALAARGDPAGAERHYRAALALRPGYPDAENDLGNLYMQAGRPAEAVLHYQMAIKNRPGYADAHYNLGNALAGTGHTGEAARHYKEALNLRPDYAEAEMNWGNLLARGGKIQQAARHFEAALKLRPSYAQAHFNLAQALALLGRKAEAAEHFRIVLKLAPDFPGAQAGLEALK